MTRLVPYILTAIGLGAAAKALQLGLWSYGEPAAGLFPFVASVLLIGTSLACARETTPAGEPIDLPRLIAYCAALAFFCLLLELIGFALSAFLFLAVVLLIIERMNRKAAIFIAVTFAFSTWGLFEGLLSVPLPHGLWGV
ncbi:tripartite tricarboxylate transporter TctB family protein [Agrobacterium deltaense]|uniref:tripartite tricarboxylate transporter TctB family protein n=1 Tax=Agrobacterium deltaense TaxID=1183412 RepID=UPI003FD01E66